MPADARRAAATTVPRLPPILAREPLACQLGCNNNLGRRIRKLPVVNRKRQGTLDRVTNGHDVANVGVNRPHDDPAADRSLVTVLVNESVNVTGRLCMSDQRLDVHRKLVSTREASRLGTLGTNEATKDDHIVFSLQRVNCRGIFYRKTYSPSTDSSA